MSTTTEIERFANDAMNNEKFREELKAFGSDQDAVISYANTKGYNFSMSDLDALVASGELSDSQLDAVAGGSIILYTDGTTTITGGTVIGIYKTKGSTLIW